MLTGGYKAAAILGLPQSHSPAYHSSSHKNPAIEPVPSGDGESPPSKPHKLHNWENLHNRGFVFIISRRAIICTKDQKLASFGEIPVRILALHVLTPTLD